MIGQRRTMCIRHRHVIRIVRIERDGVPIDVHIPTCAPERYAAVFRHECANAGSPDAIGIPRIDGDNKVVFALLAKGEGVRVRICLQARRR